VNSLQIGFLELAIPAELTKWLFLVVFLCLNRYYDEYIDGVVYSICLSLGFAAILGTLFVYDFVDYSFWIFFKKGLVTALVLIPLHFMSGSSMGYFLALARKRYKVVNYLGALATAIVIDGAVCTMLVMMGGEWGYYLIVGIVLTALSLAFYAQINHLLRLDKENK
jgi:RsiW-degrading membrane proteinase PrsW (M82 family)